MSSHTSPRRRRRATAGVAVALTLTFTATACGGGGEDTASSKPGAAEEAAQDKDGLADRLPEDLPSSVQDLDLEKWKKGGWKDWDKDTWLREAPEFVNPYLPDHWKPDRMEEADGNDRAVPATVETSSESSSRPPSAVQAKPVGTPYTQHAAPAGKIFMETPEGPMVCSGTVVEDPRNPGRSNLVATAGHCVHAGENGGWFRNIMFVPAYNDDGLSAAQVGSAQQRDVYPYGQWWVEWIQTTEYWIERGADSGGGGAQQDFAVLKVRSDPETGKSLEETVGAAVKINFNAPPIARFAGVSSYGYPAAPPYKGARMFQCTDEPSRYSLDPSQPPMYWIGCTMTGGMSGGGWFAEGPGGKAELVSVNSLINRPDVTWATGPRLDRAAEGVFRSISKKYGDKN